MRMTCTAWLGAAVLMGNLAIAQAPATPKKHLLVLGEEKGYRHESVSHAMAVIEQLGQQTGLWDTTIRTDTEALTKKKLEFNAKNLNSFDAILMFTGGDLEMDAQQKADFLSFIHDDGKGLVGVHSAAITWVKWPEFVEMLSRAIPYYHLRHLIPPGITGWAQINYGYGSSVQESKEKSQYDLYYIRNVSAMFDLMIVFDTARAVLVGRGVR